MIRALLAVIVTLLITLAGALYMVRSSSAETTEARLEAASQVAINSRLERAASVADRAVLQMASSKARIYTEIKEVIREVPVYLPAGTPDLPAGFRLLHDAAASGGPFPAAASSPDASPVAAQVAAGTVIDNYGTCRDTAAQLVALQEWVRGVTK